MCLTMLNDDASSNDKYQASCNGVLLPHGFRILWCETYSTFFQILPSMSTFKIMLQQHGGPSQIAHMSVRITDMALSHPWPDETRRDQIADGSQHLHSALPLGVSLRAEISLSWIQGLELLLAFVMTRCTSVYVCLHLNFVCPSKVEIASSTCNIQNNISAFQKKTLLFAHFHRNFLGMLNNFKITFHDEQGPRLSCLFCMTKFLRKGKSICIIYHALTSTAFCCEELNCTWVRWRLSPHVKGVHAADPIEVYARPRIYIYDDLQSNWTHCAPHIVDDQWAFHIYGAEIQVSRYFNVSVHRTRNPEEADLFFVPALIYCARVVDGKGGLCKHLVSLLLYPARYRPPHPHCAKPFVEDSPKCTTLSSLKKSLEWYSELVALFTKRARDLAIVCRNSKATDSASSVN